MQSLLLTEAAIHRGCVRLCLPTLSRCVSTARPRRRPNTVRSLGYHELQFVRSVRVCRVKASKPAPGLFAGVGSEGAATATPRWPTATLRPGGPQGPPTEAA